MCLVHAGVPTHGTPVHTMVQRSTGEGRGEDKRGGGDKEEKYGMNQWARGGASHDNGLVEADSARRGIMHKRQRPDGEWYYG